VVHLKPRIIDGALQELDEVGVDLDGEQGARHDIHVRPAEFGRNVEAVEAHLRRPAGKALMVLRRPAAGPVRHGRVPRPLGDGDGPGRRTAPARRALGGQRAEGSQFFYGRGAGRRAMVG